MAGYRLKKAEEVRINITQKLQKQCVRYYEQLYREIKQKVEQMGAGDLQRINLMQIMRDINRRINEINQAIEQNIKSSMIDVCVSVTEDKAEYLLQYGFDKSIIEDAFIRIPSQIVENILNGQIYQEGWSLSSAIWGSSQQTQAKIQEIVSKGVASGKSALEIARDVEMYVNPTMSKEAKTIQSWRYKKDKSGQWIYEKDKNGNVMKDRNGNPIRKRFHDSYYPGKVDYNALRLARTMVSHSYQQAFERVNKNDPFVMGYRWITSNFHGRICDICREREGKIFPKDELPLDHPNGMCTFEAVISDSMKEIARKIGLWYQSPQGTFPEIDRYYLDIIGQLEE